MKRKTFLIGTLLLASTLLISYFYFMRTLPVQKKASIQVGLDYEVLTNTRDYDKNFQASSVQVIYFFAYDCLTCQNMATEIEKWMKYSVPDIEFEEIPISVGNVKLQHLEKIHYLIQLLGQPKIGHTTASLIFKWLYIDQKDLFDKRKVKDSFIQQGVSESSYEAARQFQVGIDAYMRRGSSLQKNYKIQTVPTFIIGGRYMTNAVMLNNDLNRLFKIVNYLIDTVKKEQNEFA